MRINEKEGSDLEPLLYSLPHRLPKSGRFMSHRVNGNACDFISHGQAALRCNRFFIFIPNDMAVLVLICIRKSHRTRSFIVYRLSFHFFLKRLNVVPLLQFAVLSGC